jgi:hypothetical protein
VSVAGPNPEFALGEFALSEFALSASAITESGYFAAGQAVFSPDAVGVAQAAFSIAGGGVAAWRGDAVAPADATAVGAAAATFARDLVASIDFVAAGVADVDVDAGARVNTRFQLECAGTPNMRGAAIAHGEFTATGTAVSDVQMQVFSHVVMSSQGTATVVPTYGAVSSVYFLAEGKAATYFEPNQEPVFDIRGATSVAFVFGVTADVSFAITGQAVSYCGGSAITDAAASIDSYTTPDFRAGAYLSGAASAIGVSGAVFDGLVARTGTFVASGEAIVLPIGSAAARAAFGDASQSVFVPDAQAVMQGRFAANGGGASAFAVVSKLVDGASFGAAGSAQFNLDGGVGVPTDFSSDGASLSLLYAGSPVYTYLPPSSEAVVRPFEPRGVIRPYEERMVVR